MKLTEALDHVIRLYRGGSRDTLYFEGPPGIGKTSGIMQAAEALGIGYSKITGPNTDLLDFGGLPAVLDMGDGKGPVAKRLRFDEMIPVEGAGLLCVDEINAIPPTLQAGFHALCGDRRVGNVCVGADWLIIATGNRIADRAVAQRMPTSLVSRMCRIEIEPDREAFILRLAMLEGSVLVRAFLQSRPDLFVTFDPNVPGPFATARTWEYLSRTLVAYGDDGSALPPFAALCGWVGEGPATEFSAYASMAAQLVSPDTVLMAPDTAPVPKEPGALYAITTALAAKAAPGNLDKVIIYLDRCRAEFAVYCIKSALSIQLGRLNKLGPEERRRFKLLEDTRAFGEFVARNKDLLA